MRNPFLDDVHVPGAPGAAAGPDVDGAHPEALRRLIEELPGGDESAPEAEQLRTPACGRVVLLLAPRAGFGKSHLIARFGKEAADRVEWVPLAFNPESPVRWENIFGQLVDALLGGIESGARHGWEVTRLDRIARRLFARVNASLIAAGTVPCADPKAAEDALNSRFLELFDFADPGQVVARWFGEHFGKLLRPASEEVARAYELPPSRAAYWLRALCSFAQSAGESPATREEAARLAFAGSARPASDFGGLSITQIGGQGDNEAEYKDKVRDLCRLVSGHQPLVFVLDQLDAFHRDPEGGRRIAYFVTELQTMVPRELTILSLNEDVWASAFEGTLPSAYEDRLSGNVVNLKGLGVDDAVALVEARLKRSGVDSEAIRAFLAFLRLGEYFAGERGRLVSPRVVLRYAAIHWDVFNGESRESQLVLGKSLEEENTQIPSADGGSDVAVVSPTDQPVIAPESRAESGAAREGAEPANEEAHPREAFLEGDRPRDRVLDDQLSSEISAVAEGLAEVAGGESADAAPRTGVVQAETKGALIPKEAPSGPVESSGDDSAPEPPRKSVLPKPGPRRDVAAQSPPPENAFQRLKEMITRLRHERQASPVPEEARKESAAEEVPPAAAPRKEVRRADTQAQREAAGETQASSSEEVDDGERLSLAPSGRPTLEVGRGDPIMSAFHRARDRWRSASLPEELDWSRFERLIGIAGKRFPIVRYEVFTISEFQDFRVAKWGFRDNEIYFGFCGLDEWDFWCALNRFVEGRVQRSGDREKGLHAKALGFALGQRSIPDTSELGALDLVVLSRSELASIYAADEMLQLAERGEINVDPGQVLGLLASELDVFWRRITRPVADRRRDAA